MIEEQIKVTGSLKLTVTNPEGDVKQEVEVPNVVVTAGKNYIADRMKNNTTVMSHMAIGTNTGSAAVGNTALGAETGRVSLTSTNVTNNAVAYVGSFPAGTGTGAITEAGILSASSGGTLLCRTVFSVINKASGDTLGITWTITVS
jgi:hypothetical protein|tara:strand:+ start:944 stop:1381 length:438 start_codon:yes stop_codon:yes gene_type:complete